MKNGREKEGGVGKGKRKESERDGISQGRRGEEKMETRKGEREKRREKREERKRKGKKEIQSIPEAQLCKRFRTRTKTNKRIQLSDQQENLRYLHPSLSEIGGDNGWRRAGGSAPRWSFVCAERPSLKRRSSRAQS